MTTGKVVTFVVRLDGEHEGARCETEVAALDTAWRLASGHCRGVTVFAILDGEHVRYARIPPIEWFEADAVEDALCGVSFGHEYLVREAGDGSLG